MRPLHDVCAVPLFTYLPACLPGRPGLHTHEVGGEAPLFPGLHPEAFQTFHLSDGVSGTSGALQQFTSHEAVHSSTIFPAHRKVADHGKGEAAI